MLFIYFSFLFFFFFFFFFCGGVSFNYSPCIQCCLFIYLFIFIFFLVVVFLFPFFLIGLRLKGVKIAVYLTRYFVFQEKYVFFLLFLNCYDHVSFSLLDCFLLLLCCCSTSTGRINDHVGTVS